MSLPDMFPAMFPAMLPGQQQPDAVPAPATDYAMGWPVIEDALPWARLLGHDMYPDGLHANNTGENVSTSKETFIDPFDGQGGFLQALSLEAKHAVGSEMKKAIEELVDVMENDMALFRSPGPAYEI